MNIEWKQEDPFTWSARVLPNPQGLQLAVDLDGPPADWTWRVYATTDADVEEIQRGDAETLTAAKAAAERWAREHLGKLRDAIADLLVYPGFSADVAEMVKEVPEECDEGLVEVEAVALSPVRTPETFVDALSALVDADEMPGVLAVEDVGLVDGARVVDLVLADDLPRLRLAVAGSDTERPPVSPDCPRTPPCAVQGFHTQGECRAPDIAAEDDEPMPWEATTR